MEKKMLLTAVLVSVLDLFYHVWICEGDVSPSRSTEPPTFLPLSPENDTVHAVDTISLSSSFNVRNSSTLKVGNSVLDQGTCSLS